jgi:hypothetical protein
MTRSFWKSKLLPFLVPDKQLNKSGEDCYSVRPEVKIAFWCDGGLRVEGGNKNLEISFKDAHLLHLMVGNSKTIRSYRLPYSRLISFELIHKNTHGESPLGDFISN